MNNKPQTRKTSKTPFFAAFSVGAVLFSAHAGGGFATGNQANTYYVGLGWSGIIAAVIAMLLLTLTMRQAMVMYNSHGLSSYKELFQTLYHPFDKLEWVFEIFFYIMVLMAVAAAISGAASALQSYFGLNYYIGVGIVGVIVLMLTIFGAGIVRAASTWMGIAILVTAISIYAIGIFKSDSGLFTVLASDFAKTGFGNMPKAIQLLCVRRLPVRHTAHNDRLRYNDALRARLLKGDVDILCHERRRTDPVDIHAHVLAGRLQLRRRRRDHSNAHGLQCNGHPRTDRYLRRMPAPVPDLDRCHYHLRLCCAL